MQQTKLRPVPFIFLMVLSGLLLAGCEGGGNATTFQGASTGSTNNTSQPQQTVPTTARGRYGDLEFSISVPKTRFAQGETFDLTSTIQNVGNETITPTIRLGPLLIIKWYRDGNELERGGTETAGYGQAQLAPGEMRTTMFRNIESQPAGTYTVVGVLDNARTLTTPEQVRNKQPNRLLSHSISLFQPCRMYLHSASLYSTPPVTSITGGGEIYSYRRATTGSRRDGETGKDTPTLTANAPIALRMPISCVRSIRRIRPAL